MSDVRVWVQNSNGVLSMLAERRYMLTVIAARDGWEWRVSEAFPWLRRASGVAASAAGAKLAAQGALVLMRAPDAACGYCGEPMLAHERRFDGPGIAGRGIDVSCARAREARS